MESRLDTRHNKRQRSENWLEEDNVCTVTSRIFSHFNNMAKIPRTLQQIKTEWSIIKIAAKKSKFRERKERFQTGGGPPPVSEPASGEDIAVWLPHEFAIDTNEFDSNTQNFQKIKEKEQERVPQEINIEKDHDIIEMILEPSTSTQPEDTTTTTTKFQILEPSTSTQPEDTTTTTTTTKPKAQNYRLKNKMVSRTSKDDATLQIADTETACRKELHEAQMENEKQKLKNLLLKEQVLQAKLDYFKNKLK